MASGGGSSMIGRVKGPPCKVCGDEASGFHYGVDSCEGCKGFFRRCITQGMTHHCAANEACEITPFSRNSCQFCRLKKCFHVGMSREASRLGRRPKRLKDPQDQQLMQHQSQGTKDMMTAGHRGAFNHQSSQFQPDLCMVELQAMVQSFNSGRVHPTPPISIPFSKYLPPSLSSTSHSTKLEPGHLISSSSSSFAPYSPLSPVGLLKSEPHCLSPRYEPMGGSAFSLKFDSLTALPPKFEPFSSLSPKFDPMSPVTPAQSTSVKLDPSFGFGSPDVDSANSRSSISGDGRASVGGSSNGSSLDRDMSKSFRHVDVTVGGGGGGAVMQSGRRNSHCHNFGLSSSVDSAALSRLNDPSFTSGIGGNEDYKPDIRDAIGFIDRAGIVHYNVPPGMIRIMTPHRGDRRSTDGLSSELPQFSANRRLADGQVRRDRSSLDMPLGGSMSRVNELGRNVLTLDERRHCVLPQPRAEGFNHMPQDFETMGDSKPSLELLDLERKNNVENVKIRIDEPINIDQRNLQAGCKRNRAEESDEEMRSSSESPVEETVVMTMPSVEEMKESIQHLIEIGSADLAESRKLLLSDAIVEIVESHMTTCNYTVEKILKGLDKYDNICKAQYNGIPNSSDPQTWSLCFIKNMVPVIKRVVNFSKRLPAFKDLSQADQIRLIQQNSFEVILVRYTKLFTATGLFVPDMTEKIPRHKVELMPNLGEFFVEQYKFADVFNLLKLTDEELGLLTGIMIVRPENSVLENEKGVRKIRELYLQALYQKMKELRPDSYKEHYEKTLSILPYTTYINSIHSQKLEKMKMNPHFKDKELDLHEEVFTT